MAEKVRFGVIGTGGISRYHMTGWIKSRLGQLVAACDVQPANLDSFCKEFNVPPEAAYSDPFAMLRREKLDCVSICTWAQHHPKIVVAAAKAGVRGILCEKPMAYSIAEADAMLKAVEKAGTKVLIMHQRRYHRPLTKARVLIARGGIGDVHTLVARGGGGLTNTHTHYVDMMRYVLADADAEWVLAQAERSTNRWERCSPIEDRLAGLIGFQGGARGLIDSDTPLDGAAKGGMWVYGTHGAIDLFGGPLVMNARTGGKWSLIEAKGQVDPPVCYVRDLPNWQQSVTIECYDKRAAYRFKSDLPMCRGEWYEISGTVRYDPGTKKDGTPRYMHTPKDGSTRVRWTFHELNVKRIKKAGMEGILKIVFLRLRRHLDSPGKNETAGCLSDTAGLLRLVIEAIESHLRKTEGGEVRTPSVEV